mmetsp:Transcript_15141/g.45334  ORF Transcript_15141/g.45334 Transcript_15141/m.45334 type:complete len:93 (-) Transcript_15141:1394-1672(-)
MESDFASAPPGLSESAVFSRARRRAVAERSCQYVYAGSVGTRPDSSDVLSTGPLRRRRQAPSARSHPDLDLRKNAAATALCVDTRPLRQRCA